MSRHRLITLTVVGAALLSGVSVSRAEGPGAGGKPNVVLILADDLGYECLSAHGSADYRTPHLDKLAQSGIRFTHYYTQPLCTPTRVQLMTGRYNFRNYEVFGRLPKAEKTFAHMLKSAGYQTAIAGKWQLDGGGPEGQTPAQAGFDEYCLWNITQGEHTTTRSRYADPSLLYLDRATKQPALKEFTDEYGPDVCDRYLDPFLERCTREKKPFLAYYPLMLTHGPFQPTPQSPQWKEGRRKMNQPRFFKDMVAYMDLQVGRIVAKLDQLGARENTLLIFTSDNGTGKEITSKMTDGRTVPGAKGTLTDAGSHEPLIVSWPGRIPPGQVKDDLVDSSDILPTLAAATGAALPMPPGDGIIDGRNFLSLVKGEKRKPREWVLIDYRAGQNGPGKNDGRYVRDHRWKLYGRGHAGEPKFRSGQLFDMQKDPEELTPVTSEDGEAAEARKRLQKVLDSMHPSKT